VLPLKIEIFAHPGRAFSLWAVKSLRLYFRGKQLAEVEETTLKAGSDEGIERCVLVESVDKTETRHRRECRRSARCRFCNVFGESPECGFKAKQTSSVSI